MARWLLLNTQLVTKHLPYQPKMLEFRGIGRTEREGIGRNSCRVRKNSGYRLARECEFS